MTNGVGCCCRCASRISAIIVGCLQLVFGLASSIFTGYFAAAYGWFWVFSVSFGVQMIIFIVSALLLVGIILRNFLLAKIFIYGNTIILIYNLIAGAYIFYIGGWVASESWGLMIFVAVWTMALGISYMINSVITIFYICIVHSYVTSERMYLVQQPHQQEQEVAIILQPVQVGQPFLQPGMQPAMQPVMQPGMQPVMQPILQPAMQPVMQPAMQPYQAGQPGHQAIGNRQPNELAMQPSKLGQPGWESLQPKDNPPPYEP